MRKHIFLECMVTDLYKFHQIDGMLRKTMSNFINTHISYLFIYYEMIIRDKRNDNIENMILIMIFLFDARSY